MRLVACLAFAAIVILLMLLGLYAFGTQLGVSPADPHVVIDNLLEKMQNSLDYTNKNAPALFLIILLILLLYSSLKQDKGMLILPFQIVDNSDNQRKYNNKAISDMLVAELQRIKQINDFKHPGIKNEDLKIPSQILTGESASIPQIGTIGISSATISIGELIYTFKQLLPGSSHKQVVTGCLEDYGSKIKLVIHAKGKKNFTCEAETDVQKIRIKEDAISDLIRELSLKMVYHLSNESMSAGTLLGFKYYTQALGNYQQYMLTRQIKCLKCASENCAKAAKIEPKYSRTFYLFENIGIAYYERYMWKEAAEMFCRAITMNPMKSETWYNKGVALNQLGKDLGYRNKLDEAIKIYDAAIEAFDKALYLNPKCSDSWNFRSIALREQGMALDKQCKALKEQDRHNEAIKKHDEAIKKYNDALKDCITAIGINSELSDAWHNKDPSLYDHMSYEKSKNAYDRAIKIDKQLIDFWENKCKILNAQGRRDEAVKARNEANKNKLQSAYFWNRKGDAVVRNQGVDDGVAGWLLKANKIALQLADFWDRKSDNINIRDKSDMDKAYDEAINAYDIAIGIQEYANACCKEAILSYNDRINQQYVDAWYNKGILLIKMEHNDEAVQCFDKAIEVAKQFAPSSDKTLELNSQLEKCKALRELDRGPEADLALDQAYKLGYNGLA